MQTLQRMILGLSILASGTSCMALPTPDGTPLMASRRADYRASIRATPLLERPNRPGHFYGNTVRRLNGMSGGAYVPGPMTIDGGTMFPY